MSNGSKGAYDRMGNYYEFTSQNDMHERMGKQHVLHAGPSWLPPTMPTGNPLADPHDDLDELPAPPRRSLAPEDRALLELAARAIGCVRFEEVEGEEYAKLHFADGSVMHAWNPLAFSGDALELAVKLGFDVCISSGTVCVGDARCVQWLAEGHLNDDPLADTRHAIVRAAAEIGKQQ